MTLRIVPCHWAGGCRSPCVLREPWCLSASPSVTRPCSQCAPLVGTLHPKGNSDKIILSVYLL